MRKKATKDIYTYIHADHLGEEVVFGRCDTASKAWIGMPTQLLSLGV